MKYLTSETFDPTTFKNDYTLVIWSVGQEISKSFNEFLTDCKKHSIMVYIIDVSLEENACLSDYYQYDMSKGYYFLVYNNEGQIIYQSNDYKNVINFIF